MTTPLRPRRKLFKRVALGVASAMTVLLLCCIGLAVYGANLPPEEVARLAATRAARQAAREATQEATHEAERTASKPLPTGERIAVDQSSPVAATVAPTAIPTLIPTVVPTTAPTLAPTETPTAEPTIAPTATPLVVTGPGLGLTREYVEDNIGSGFYTASNVRENQPDGSVIELKRTMVEGSSALNNDTWAAEVIGPDEDVRTASALFSMSWTKAGLTSGPMVMYKIAMATLPDEEEYFAVADFIEQSVDGILAAHNSGADTWEDTLVLDEDKRVVAVAILMDDGAVCTFTVTARPDDAQ